MKTTSSSKKISSSKKEEVDLSSFGISKSKLTYEHYNCPETVVNALKGEQFTVMRNKETGNLFLRGNRGHIVSLSFDSIAAEGSTVTYNRLEPVISKDGYKCWRIK